MRTLRLIVLGGAMVVAFVATWSCSDKKRCSEEELEPFRRYPCANGLVTCDKTGTIDLGALDPSAQQFVACCRCGATGAPSCKTCDEMGY